MKFNFLKAIIYLTILILFVATILDICTSAYYRAIIWAAFILIFLILLKIKRIPLIIHFSLAMLLLVAILGEYWLYGKVIFFDKIVHFISPLILCNLVFHLAKDKIKDKKILILFCIAAVMTISVGWEMVEYGFDNLVASKMQGVYFQEGQFFGTYERLYRPIQAEIDDTMTDLIANLAGSLVFAGIYFFKERKIKLKQKKK